MEDRAAPYNADRAPAAETRALEPPRWREIEAGRIRVSLRGYMEDSCAELLPRRLADPRIDPIEEASRILGESRGHFALVISGPDWVVAAVDWVRSIPIFFARSGFAWEIDDRAERLRQRTGLDQRHLDQDAALSLAMAGYTIDRATLYRGLEMLGPGEAVLFRHGATPRRMRYRAYRPWLAGSGASPQARERQLAEATLDVIQRMLDFAQWPPVGGAAERWLRFAARSERRPASGLQAGAMLQLRARRELRGRHGPGDRRATWLSVARGATDGPTNATFLPAMLIGRILNMLIPVPPCHWFKIWVPFKPWSGAASFRRMQYS